MNETSAALAKLKSVQAYRLIWRWHFYAGLFCIPFIIWLSVTGAIYLFKPQYEAWQDAPYRHLQQGGTLASAQAQVAAALAAVPGTTLNAYELPRSAHGAPVVIVGRDASKYRVYVHPQTLAILKVQNDDDRLMSIVHDLHGHLMLGDRGSLLVELAASWAIVMIVSGIYLWWPRGQGIAGVLYPRLAAKGRPYWRDLHAVVGFWVSAFALFLLVSGLPWAHFWGSNLETLRQFAAAAPVTQDWSTSKSADLVETRAMNQPPAAAAEDEHAEHHHHGTAMTGTEATSSADPYAPLDRLVATVAPMALAPPVRISPPSQGSPRWTAQSLSQNRPLRVNLELDPASGAILKRGAFSDKKLLDRVISVGVAAHEGQLFGWFNQALGVFTAVGLILLSVSGFMMWFKRRPEATLGAPKTLAGTRVAPLLIALAIMFGLFLPMFGLSMIAVLLIERGLLRRIAPVRDFLGLQTA